MYFVKKDSKSVIARERHRIKIPTLGWVRPKEKGYIPTDCHYFMIKSGAVSCIAGRYYVSVLVEQSDIDKSILNSDGIGVDLGLKEFVICSNNTVFKNINIKFSYKKT